MIANHTRLLLAMARVCMNAQAFAKSNIRAATFGRIARALGVDPADIMDDSPPDKNQGQEVTQ